MDNTCAHHLKWISHTCGHGVNCLFNVTNHIKWTIAKMSEEETELRDLVAQTLENNGVLSRIRVYKIVCILLRIILLQYNVTSWLMHIILMFTLIFQWYLNEFYRRKRFLDCYDVWNLHSCYRFDLLTCKEFWFVKRVTTTTRQWCHAVWNANDLLWMAKENLLLDPLKLITGLSY